MTGTSKRPPKPRFGESPLHQAWDDDTFEFLHVPALPVAIEDIQAIAKSLDTREDSEHVSAEKRLERMERWANRIGVAAGANVTSLDERRPA
jgi:hypothetical protein